MLGETDTRDATATRDQTDTRDATNTRDRTDTRDATDTRDRTDTSDATDSRSDRRRATRRDTAPIVSMVHELFTRSVSL